MQEYLPAIRNYGEYAELWYEISITRAISLGLTPLQIAELIATDEKEGVKVPEDKVYLSAIVRAVETRRRSSAAAGGARFRKVDHLWYGEKGECWSFHLFEYGKNREGYWTGEKMKYFVEDMVDCASERFPDCLFVCKFDWSSNHDCMPPTAPSASALNVGIGRKNHIKAIMEPTVLLEDTPGMKAGETQTLTYEKGDPPPYFQPELAEKDYIGKAKGLRQTLWERKLYIPGMTRDGGKGEKQDLRMSMEDVLAKQPDFASVRSMLEISITERGHLILMVPKYHSECNEIELLWGASKSYTRRFCSYTYPGLLKNILDSFGEQIIPKQGDAATVLPQGPRHSRGAKQQDRVHGGGRQVPRVQIASPPSAIGLSH